MNINYGNPRATERTSTTALLPRTTAPTPTSATSYPTTTKSTTINTQALSTLEESIRPVVGMGFPRDRATEALQVHQWTTPTNETTSTKTNSQERAFPSFCVVVGHVPLPRNLSN